MSKELKALERLKSSLKSYCYEFTSSMEDLERGLFEEDYEAVKVIETTIKENQDIQSCFDDYGLSIKDIRKVCVSYKQREKHEKALEIIKEKQVDIHNFKEILIKQEWTYEQYLDEENDINTSGHQFAYKMLTKEEFELLKEVLCSEN